MLCLACATDGSFAIANSPAAATNADNPPDQPAAGTLPTHRSSTDRSATGRSNSPIHTRLRITDLQPGDTATVRHVFDGLSGRSRYLRFHAGRATLPIRMQRGLADIRPGQHVAHVAAVGGHPVGLVRWIQFADDRWKAELAVEVIDSAQRKGVGRALISQAARSALAAGIMHFVGYFSPANSELRGKAIAHGAMPDPEDRSLVGLPVAALLASLETAAPRLPVQRHDFPGAG